MTCSSVLPSGKTIIGLIDRRCWIVVRKPAPVQRMLALTRIVCFSSPPSSNMLMMFLTVCLNARASQFDAANEKDMAIEGACSSSPRTQYQPVEAHFSPRCTGIYCFRHRHQRTFSSLPIFASLVKNLCWTILVPLAVITELDGIATNNSSLGEVAMAAVEYVASHMRSHSIFEGADV